MPPTKKPDALQRGLGVVAATLSKEEAARQQREKEQEQIQACISSGGRWDQASKTCIYPEKKIAPPNLSETDKFKAPTAEISQGGSLIELSDGRNFPNTKEGRATAAAALKIGQETATGGAELQGLGVAPAGTTAERQRKQAILSQLGQVTGVSQAELNRLIEQFGLDNQFQEGLPGALREGVTLAGQRALTFGGAAGAAALAGGVTAPAALPAAAVGAAAGVVSGFWTAIRGATKAEAKEDVKNAVAEFTQLRTAMSQTATMASTGLINEVEAVELYNAQLTRMLQIEAQVKYLQDTNLKDYLSDGSDDLAKIQTYINQVAPAYRVRIQSSLINPTSKTPYSDIVLQDLQDLQNE